MDPQLLLWIVIGALAVVPIVGVILALASYSAMRRLGTAVEERWRALDAALDERRAAAAPLLEDAPPAQRASAEAALAKVSAEPFPTTKAEAEAEAQRALRPIVQAAAQQPAGSAIAEARAALAALEDQAQQRRRDYNTVVRELNAKTRRFPTSAWTKAVGGRRDFFEVDQAGAVAEPPRIQF
ncbi:LemA family protein [Agrococcus terreus]|uniref:LemA protein n=1 Tax=Agrococcus terreus TaxID=574649 RepID=A0ABQ2KDZ5_9MICO|nr:LemA family protein [Agrococcus terreus]GGN80667.1 hypothetical protein GCM10010968_08730 [Agrococcus terreus]